MIINASAINTSAINAESFTGITVVVSDTVTLSNTSSYQVTSLSTNLEIFVISTQVTPSTLTTTFMETVTSTLSLSTSDATGLNVFVIVENFEFQNLVTSALSDIEVLSTLMLTGQLSSVATVSDTVLEYLSLVESVLLVYQNTVNSGLTFSSSVLEIPTLLQDIQEILSITSTQVNNPILQSVVNSLITINGILTTGSTEILNSSLVISSIISDIARLKNIVTSNLTVSETVDKTVVLLTVLESEIDLSEVVNTTAILKELLSSTFTISLVDPNSDFGYATYLFSPESSSVTEYSNYNFVGYTSHKGKYLMINSTGLYEYGGDKDNGADVVYDVLFSATTFNTSALKSIPNVYLGTSLTGQLYMKVRVDGKGEFTYRVNKYTDGLETIKVDIGRGLIGRYFQFELIGSGDIFDLDSIEFTPINLSRKI